MKRILLYFLFLLTAYSVTAQPPDNFQNSKREKIRALYVAYVSQQLQFTPDEAQRFWPVHEQFESEMMSINNSPLSDLDKQQRILDLKRRYQPSFERIIGPERSSRFFGVNDQFRNKLMEIRQHRQEMKAEGRTPGMRGDGMRRGGMKRENMFPKN